MEDLDDAARINGKIRTVNDPFLQKPLIIIRGSKLIVSSSSDNAGLDFWDGVGIQDASQGARGQHVTVKTQDGVTPDWGETEVGNGSFKVWLMEVAPEEDGTGWLQ